MGRKAYFLFLNLQAKRCYLELVTDSGKTVSCDWAHWADLLITANGVELNGDVNQDGTVNILDLVLVGQNLGQKPPSEPRADVNKDGPGKISLILCLLLNTSGKKVAAAPSQLDVIKSTASSP